MTIVSLLLLLSLAQESPAREETPAARKIDGIAAIVNNEAITESELQSRLEAARKSFGFKDPAEWDRFSRDTLVAMVREKLYLQAARRSSIDQRRVDIELEELMKHVEKEAGGRASLLEKLQHLGQTYEEFKRARRAEIESRNLQYYEMGFIPGASGRFGSETYVSPGDMKQFYKARHEEFSVSEATRARQIFLTAEDDLELDAAKAKGEEILDRIRKGEEFVKLAEEFSEWKPKEGGDMGWVPREGASFDRRIVSFLFSQPAETVSDPIVLSSGVAIVKIEERRNKRARSFEECQLEIMNRILRERHEERSRALTDKLLRDSYVWPENLFR